MPTAEIEVTDLPVRFAEALSLSEAGTEVILESTANGMGNLFHETWRGAEDGENDYIAIFVPWYWQDEYRKTPPRDFVPSEVASAARVLRAGRVGMSRDKTADSNARLNSTRIDCRRATRDQEIRFPAS